MSHSPPAPIIVSPHLDDAVFSCGELLERTPGATVVTVFAGTPTDSCLTDWDRRCGFPDAEQAMRARRAEDAAALATLGARPVWLDLLDAQYGGDYRPEDIEERLAPCLERQRGGMVAVPMGLFHSDHLVVHEACLRLHARYPDLDWLCYEDALYRRLPGLLQERLASLLRSGWRLTPAIAAPARGLKTRAVRAYASQLRAFGEGGHEDTDLPERLWRLARHGTG